MLPTLAQASAADAQAEAEAQRKEEEEQGNSLRAAPAAEGSGGDSAVRRRESGIFEQAAAPKPSVKLPKGLLLGAIASNDGNGGASALF